MQQQQQHANNSDANKTSIENNDSNAPKLSMQFAVERFETFRHIVGKLVLELDTQVWRSADVCDKLDTLVAVLNASVENCDYEAHTPTNYALRSTKTLPPSTSRSTNFAVDLFKLSLSSKNCEDGRDNMLRNLDEMDETWHQLYESRRYATSRFVSFAICASRLVTVNFCLTFIY